MSGKSKKKYKTHLNCKSVIDYFNNNKQYAKGGDQIPFNGKQIKFL